MQKCPWIDQVRPMKMSSSKSSALRGKRSTIMYMLFDDMLNSSITELCIGAFHFFDKLHHISNTSLCCIPCISYVNSRSSFMWLGHMMGRFWFHPCSLRWIVGIQVRSLFSSQYFDAIYCRSWSTSLAYMRSRLLV